MTRRRKVTALLTYSNSRDISGEQFQIDLGVGITNLQVLDKVAKADLALVMCHVTPSSLPPSHTGLNNQSRKMNESGKMKIRRT